MTKLPHSKTLLSLVRGDVLHNDSSIAIKILSMEKLGTVKAIETFAQTLNDPHLGCSALIYAASCLTIFQKGLDPKCLDLFSLLPVRNPNVIRLSNALHHMPADERAAVYAREAMKLIVQTKIQPVNPETN